MRKQIAAGNWKMNLEFNEAVELTTQITACDVPENVDVILGVPFPYLKDLLNITSDNTKVHIAAQNCSAHVSGAYTGETSAIMLKSIGVSHVILGHSERRQYHGETDELILAKIKLAQSNGLTPIYCCGEPLEIREAGTHVDFVKNQLQASILKLNEKEISNLIVAYEPIWAIGTGKTASPEQAQEIQRSIRSIITKQFGEDISSKLSILYGGSVKPSNAKDIFGKEDVDGGLVGGASLDAESFKAIINSF